jgi:hypothetical protein
MHILWKLKKAFVKSDGGNNQPHYTLSTIVRNLEEKRIRCHNAYGKRINTTPSLLSRTTERVYEYGN